MRIERIDHFVLTVADVAATVRFYVDILGMEEVTFGEHRKALAFGRQKINLHAQGAEIQPHARMAVPGSADICLIATTLIAEVTEELRAKGVPVELGPVERTGATGKLNSIYLRDPDGNLIEIANVLNG